MNPQPGMHATVRNRAFCTQNDGDGWMLPETLRLADLGLGHDDRAKTSQPVRKRLGDRFYPSQREQSVEDSWKERELHSRNILGAEGFADLQRELRGEPPADAARKVAEDQTPYASLSPGTQPRLFPGEPTLFGEILHDNAVRRRRRSRK